MRLDKNIQNVHCENVTPPESVGASSIFFLNVRCLILCSFEMAEFILLCNGMTKVFNLVSNVL